MRSPAVGRGKWSRGARPSRFSSLTSIGLPVAVRRSLALALALAGALWSCAEAREPDPEPETQGEAPPSPDARFASSPLPEASEAEQAPAQAEAPPASDDACAHLGERIRAKRPEDPRDPLFLVNRVAAIPAEFPFSPTSIWTPCSWEASPTKDHDFVCLPSPYVLRTREALRKIAFESPAPADVTTTFDGLPVGRAGKIGFRPLLDAAREAGHHVWIRSGFRSYATQRATFHMWIQHALVNGYDRESAQRKVTQSSAHAGHSEHQLGTTVDLVFLKPGGAVYEGWDPDVFEESAAMKWIAANAHRFGVVLTYAKDKTEVTQYKYEPWHYRFVGVEAAGWAKRCNLSTEELLQARYGEP